MSVRLRVMVWDYSRRPSNRSVTVYDTHYDRSGAFQSLVDVRFTGLARDWRAEIYLDSSGAQLELLCRVPDRNDQTRDIELVFRDFISWSELLTNEPLTWLHGAIRYVMLHEADEAILLSDGRRPFDPHWPSGALRESFDHSMLTKKPRPFTPSLPPPIFGTPKERRPIFDDVFFNGSPILAFRLPKTADDELIADLLRKYPTPQRARSSSEFSPVHPTPTPTTDRSESPQAHPAVPLPIPLADKPE